MDIPKTTFWERARLDSEARADEFLTPQQELDGIINRVRRFFEKYFDGLKTLDAGYDEKRYQEWVDFDFQGKRLRAVWQGADSIYSGTRAMMGWEIRYMNRRRIFWGDEDVKTGKMTYRLGDLYNACVQVTSVWPR